jgi:peptidyl-prolyl cis-trans isomerase B (cyclophilin B)
LVALRRAGTAIVVTLVAAVLPIGCGDGEEGETTAAELPAGCSAVDAPASKDVQLPRPDERLQGPATAVVETSCGSFEIALDTARAPRTTSSFAYLAEHGLYDGTQIHRIEPGFVIQGGDPTGEGTGGPGYSVDELPPQDLSYTRGVVAMAKSPVEPPGRSGSQFFVVTAADAGLSPDYALVGRVSTGFDVVKRIEQLGVAGGKPRAPVTIERITIRSG